jgi:hypothetical protein
MKITTTTALVRGRTEKKFFLNGILIAEHQVGTELYCKITKGTRSNLRTEPKKTHYFRWAHSTLREILGDKYKSEDFRVSYPDLSWGYTGGYHTAKSVKELFTAIFSR